MQATKDNFLSDIEGQAGAGMIRDRTITVDGVTRPAIVVVENDKPSVTARQQNDAFYLEWGAARVALRPAISTLMAMTCTVSYSSAGTDANGGLSPGRMSGAMEAELLGLCTPAVTEKNDYASGSPVDLGSSIFWSQPTFSPTKAEPSCVAREASITVYFYPAANSLAVRTSTSCVVGATRITPGLSSCR